MGRSSALAMIVIACGARAELDAPAPDASSDASIEASTEPTGPPLVATSVAAGWWDTCAVLPDTGVACWGHGPWLGSLGGVDGVTVGFRFGGLTNVQRVTLGGEHGCALLADHTLRCWGNNGTGCVGNNNAMDENTPVPVTGLNVDIAQVALGNAHTCALATNGEVRCWGRCDLGQLGTGLLDPNCANPTRAPALGLTDAKQIAAGGNLSCAVTASGVSCWGAPIPSGVAPNEYVDHPTNVPGYGAATQVGAEWSYICARMSDGSVACLGENTDDFEEAGAQPSASPVTIQGLPKISSVGVGYGHACALAEDGSVWCWGENRYGQLGDGTNIGRQAPARVRGIVDAVQLTVGEWHACVLLTSAEIACWGRNWEGELADGTRENRNTPVTAHWALVDP